MYYSLINSMNRSAGYIFPSGMVSSYSANGSFNDSTGSNNLTAVNGIIATGTPKLGSGSFSSNGANNYAITSRGVFNFTSFSYNGWFKFNTLNGGIFEYQDNDNGFRFVANSDGTMFFRLFFTNGSFSSETTSIQLNTTSYIHISLNFELGVGSKIYINGSLIHTYNTALTPKYTVSPFYSIGGGGWAGFCNCLTDSVQVFNRALNSTEISSIYNSGIGREV
ncbi:Concanavalin A-like lectin/glucanases superfamily [uncultured Caudovirales phage]|uniref:Concanavalin A-like lectin/glucanases superfamily n=1 Tax=uncultured Caudovirales phage TaxID=2100421 RepID=A0A6J7WLG8_9CAUD|nr:Concanavalin A-like lectin/glucanases superfamily [uncultured Caudovirales phage]